MAPSHLLQLVLSFLASPSLPFFLNQFSQKITVVEEAPRLLHK